MRVIHKLLYTAVNLLMFKSLSTIMYEYDQKWPPKPKKKEEE